MTQTNFIKMKNIILKGFLLVALILHGSACNDFEDININPNAPTAVSPSALLTNSLRYIGMNGTLFSASRRNIPNLYIQHFAETQYTEDSRYQTINFDFSGWFASPLIDLKHIIDLNTDDATKADALSGGSNANQIAVAMIVQSFIFHHITDRWGPIPMSQSLQGRDNFKPAYDSQQQVYDQIFAQLKSAIAMMDGGAPVKGDQLFGGDMGMWRKFANSIRMVMALRLSEVDPSKGQAEFNSAMSDGVIGDGEDIMYPFLAEASNENPWYTDQITRTDNAIGSTLVDYMKPLNDPRLNIYADPAVNYGDVRGMPVGISNDRAGAIPNDEVSFPGNPAVESQNAPGPLLTRSQILFCMAEAAMRGWISGDPGQLYASAIQASMDQWGVTDQAAIDAFLAQDGVAWDAANGMSLIAHQKWVALYNQGYEAWAEWRRLDLPVLEPAEDAIHPSGQIPVRQGYPVSERDNNSANYEAAVGMLGGPDDLTTPLWWDK